MGHANLRVKRRGLIWVAAMAGLLFLGEGAALAQSTLDKLHEITPLGGPFGRRHGTEIYLNNRGYVAWADEASNRSFVWIPQSANATTGTAHPVAMGINDLNDHGQLIGIRLFFGVTLRAPARPKAVSRASDQDWASPAGTFSPGRWERAVTWSVCEGGRR
jgi:hypothetical protein